MIRLLYCSQAKSDFSEEVLKEILLISRKNNSAAGITGVLVHGGGMFMQVLEGQSKQLRTYMKILDDRRHTDSRIIQISPMKERMFNNWTMGVIEAEPLTFEHVAKLRAHRLETLNAEAFTQVIREFNALLIKT